MSEREVNFGNVNAKGMPSYVWCVLLCVAFRLSLSLSKEEED